MELLRDLVGPSRMEMYEAWWEMWSQVMPITPEKFVYLKPSLDSCQACVEARAQKIRVAVNKVNCKAKARGSVSNTYQAPLRRAHEVFLQGHHAENSPAPRKGCGCGWGPSGGRRLLMSRALGRLDCWTCRRRAAN